MEFDGRRVLITGAGGFLGRHLASRMAARGAEVCCVSRAPLSTFEPLPARVTVSGVNLRDAGETLTFFQTIRPEIVFHLVTASGGSTGVDNVLPHLEDDITTTATCLVAAQKVGVSRFIVPGSTDEPISTPGENLIPTSPYSLAKMTCVAYGRMFHQLYGTPVVICRIFMTYGPGQKSRKVIPYIVRSMLAGKTPRISSGSRLVDWIYIDDTVEALMLAGTVDGLEGRTIEIGSGSLVSINDIAARLQALIPHAPHAEAGEEPPFGSVRAADLGLARRYLHWSPKVSLQEGLRATVDFYRMQVNMVSGGIGVLTNGFAETPMRHDPPKPKGKL
jgi:UDP-glucose 4-epimerase